MFGTMKLDGITMVCTNREQKVPKTEPSVTPMFGDQRWREIYKGN